MARIYGMGTLDAKKVLYGPVKQGIWKWPSETVSRIGSISAFLSPASPFGFLPHHLCLCGKAAAAVCILIVSRPATEGRKWALLQWLSSLIQKLICPRNLQDLLLLSLAQMLAWLLMTQEASELFFDRGSPSQSRVHKKRMTGMSLSCWTGTLACRYT